MELREMKEVARRVFIRRIPPHPVRPEPKHFVECPECGARTEKPDGWRVTYQTCRACKARLLAKSSTKAERQEFRDRLLSHLTTEFKATNDIAAEMGMQRGGNEQKVRDTLARMAAEGLLDSCFMKPARVGRTRRCYRLPS